MVKIYVNGLEIETERYVEERPVIKNIDGVLEMLDGETPAEFEEFFQKNKEDLYA